MEYYFNYSLDLDLSIGNMNIVSVQELANNSYEDDAFFYAELERQISLLTEDDDRGGDYLSKYSSSTRVSCAAVKQSTERYFDWTENEGGNYVPTWILNLWRNGNGTGVFIPHIVKSRRKHSGRKKKNEKGRVYKQVAN